jgi:hypothetical protein
MIAKALTWIAAGGSVLLAGAVLMKSASIALGPFLR